MKRESKNKEGPSVGSLKAHEYNYDDCRKALCKYVILDELSFRAIEGEGFRLYSNTLEPRFVVPSRWTIARDCMQLYEEEKTKLKLKLKGQRLCLTTDTWTSIQNINYMCLTAHWIDDDWCLHKMILNFKQVVNHKGITIGKTVENCLLEWGIDRIVTVTVDNASSNNIAIDHFKSKTSRWGTTLLNNELMHVRCCAHILNLVVKDELKEEKDCIAKVRNAIRYVRYSPSRLLSFQKCVEKEKIDSKGLLRLDVETRWNSTYLMLETTEKFEDAFERLAEDDSKFKSYFSNKVIGPPTTEDWRTVRVFVRFLKLFYNVTVRFSGILYVTSNVFFHEIVSLQSKLS